MCKKVVKEFMSMLSNHLHCVAYAKTFILTVQIEIMMLIMMTNVGLFCFRFTVVFAKFEMEINY